MEEKRKSPDWKKKGGFFLFFDFSLF